MVLTRKLPPAGRKAQSAFADHIFGDKRLDKKLVIVPAIAVAVIAAGIAIYVQQIAPASKPAEQQPVQTEPETQPAQQVTNPTPPVSIKVNGNSGPDISYPIKRGESATLDVAVSPNMAGITTSLEAKLVYPECGSKEAETVVHCTPKGVSASLSRSSVSMEEHVSLKVEIARDMEAGIFPIQLIANTNVAKGPGQQPLPVTQLFPIELQIS